MDAKLGAIRIRQLVDEKKAVQKNLSVNRMLIELSLDTSIVDNMRKGHMPSADKLDPIARYLGTSVAYILGEADDKRSTAAEEAQPLLTESQKTKAEILKMLDRVPVEKLDKFKSLLQAAIDATE